MVPTIQSILTQICEWPDEQRRYDPNSYSIGYEALRGLFAQKLDFSSLIDIRAGAYAVYGWMPTILDRWPASDNTLLELGELARFARGRDYTAVRARIAPGLKEKLAVYRALNNSIVGTSKFLHFAAPSIFPIWDSRVARNFGFKHQYQLASGSNYLAYYDAVHTCIETNSETQALLKMLALPNVGQVRTLEYLLYLYDRRRHSDQAATAEASLG